MLLLIFLFGYLTSISLLPLAPSNQQYFSRASPCPELDSLFVPIWSHTYTESKKYLFWCPWNYPLFCDVSYAAVVPKCFGMYTCFSIIRNALLYPVMRIEPWFAGVTYNLAQKVKMAPEVFHRLMDRPTGVSPGSQLHLTSVGFSKGTTKMLRDPRLSWHQSIPQEHL